MGSIAYTKGKRSRLPDPGISKLSFLDHVKRMRFVALARIFFFQEESTMTCRELLEDVQKLP